jgi:hypothetical protein
MKKGFSFWQLAIVLGLGLVILLLLAILVFVPPKQSSNPPSPSFQPAQGSRF